MNNSRQLELQRKTNKLKAEVEATEPVVLFSEKTENENFEMYDMSIKAPWSDYA